MNIVSHLADTRTFLPFVHMRIYRTFARSYFTFSCPHKSLPAHIISWENDKDKDTYAFLVFPHRLFPGKVFKPLKRICATHPSHKINVYVLYNAVHNSTQGNDLPSGKSLASYWRGNEGVNRWLSIYTTTLLTLQCFCGGNVWRLQYFPSCCDLGSLWMFWETLLPLWNNSS